MTRRQFNVSLVGMRYNGLQLAVGEMVPAADISLERQPRNEHDANAIAVRVRGVIAGHLNRESARTLAPLLDGGATFELGGICADRSMPASVPLKIWLTYNREKPVAPEPAEDRAAGIYAISIVSQSKRYIGQARGINERLKQHWDDLALGTHHNPLLRDLWREVGGSGFHAEVIELAPTDLTELALSQWLYGRECHWIEDDEKRFGTFNRVRPEFVWTAGAKAEQLTQAQAAAEERKQQRVIDKAREPALRAELGRMEIEAAQRRKELNDIASMVRKLSGVRGVLFAGFPEKAALPQLLEKRIALEAQTRASDMLIAELRLEKYDISQRLRVRKRRKTSRSALDSMAVTSARRRTKKQEVD